MTKKEQLDQDPIRIVFEEAAQERGVKRMGLT